MQEWEPGLILDQLRCQEELVCHVMAINTDRTGFLFMCLIMLLQVLLEGFQKDLCLLDGIDTIWSAFDLSSALQNLF